LFVDITEKTAITVFLHKFQCQETYSIKC